MGTITYNIPIAGQPNSTEDPKITSALSVLLAFADGGIDKGNLAANSGILKIIGANSNHSIAFGLSPTVTISSPFITASWQAAHGLGGSPVWACATAFNGYCFANLTSWDATNVYGSVVYVQPSGTGAGSYFTAPAGNVTQNIAWAAIA